MKSCGDIFIQKNLCPTPFMRLQISRDGLVHTCCTGHMKRKIAVGNILENTLDEIWNGSKIKQLRQAIYDGKYNEICQPHCPTLNAIKRGKASIGRTAKYDTYNDIKQGKVHLDAPYKRIAVASDPSCNLSCIMCRSSRIKRPTKQDDRVNNVVFHAISENISKIEWLRLTGNGEVFYKKSALKFFEMLKKRDTSHLTLSIITNGQLLTKEKWDMLKQLNVLSLEIAVSIDAATGHTYEKIRRFGNWKRLVKNMEMLQEKRLEGSLDHFYVSFVVMKSNVDEMPLFIELGKSWNCNGILFTRIFDKPVGQEENFFNPPIPGYLKKLGAHLQNPIFDDPHIWINALLPYKKSPVTTESFTQK